MSNIQLYIFCAACAALISAAFLPLAAPYAGKYLLDKPAGLKTHAAPTPLLGGTAVFLGLSCALIIIRYITNFETGTLRALRGVLAGGALIYMLGLVDDFKKPAGLSPLFKLLGQAAACALLIYFDIRIKIIDNLSFSYALTFFWVIGITNALNLLDIMDGLCISQAISAGVFLLLVALPSEQIYVNFACAALVGAGLGFWPYNHTKKIKVFLGDSGSMTLGFILSACAMGADYSFKPVHAALAPLLIFAVPILDTSFVFTLRLLKNKNPFSGSADHAVLLLKKRGAPQSFILLSMLSASILCGAAALFIIYGN